jgi:DNA-binding MarR family transcriptional regulator
MTSSRLATRTRQLATGDLGLRDALVQLSFAVQAALQRVADEQEISVVQLRLFGILRDREAGMLELSKVLGLDKSSVTGLVDRAERRAFVERRGAPDDGRAVRVVLTARGREIVRTVAKRVDGEIAQLVAGLAVSDRSELARLASRVVLDDLRLRGPGFSQT